MPSFGPCRMHLEPLCCLFCAPVLPHLLACSPYESRLRHSHASQSQVTDAVQEIVRPAVLRRLSLSGAAEPTNQEYVVACNSLECAACYCRKLRDVVAADFADHFAVLAPLAEVFPLPPLRCHSVVICLPYDCFRAQPSQLAAPALR